MLHWIANKVGNGTFPFPKYYQVGREGGREAAEGERCGEEKENPKIVDCSVLIHRLLLCLAGDGRRA